MEKYTYRVIWSEEDQEFVGLCAEFPSLSWLEEEQDAALHGIVRLVSDTLKDMEANKEPIPEPLSLRKFSGNFVVRTTPEMLPIPLRRGGSQPEPIVTIRFSS